MITVELYQLRTFVAVAREAHLTRAAERLALSQPAVSAHIRALEEELGIVLFQRIPKGMLLTPAGEQIHQQAKVVLGEAENLLTQARQLTHNVSGRLQLAVQTNPSVVRLPETLTTLQQDYPDIQLELIQRSSWDIAREVREGTLDGGYMYGEVEREELTILHLVDFPLRVVGPISWQEQLNHASWAQLTAMPWVWVPERCPFSAAATAFFAARQLKVREVLVAEQEEVLCALASSGSGLTIMVEPEAQAVARAGTMALYAEPIGAVPLQFVFLKRRAADPLLQAISACLNRIWHPPIPFACPA